MRVLGKLVAAFVCAVFLPTAAYAQASLTGVARDASGAVLPGVTVEAASPVLIEKVRVTVTDGSGRFQLINLRPGDYTVTFTLPGFATVQTEGVALSGSGTVTVDAELRVGALEETITVTGEAPIVDTSSATRQVVLDADTIDALPTARSYLTLSRLIPATVGGGSDVGGTQIHRVGGSTTVHGSRSQDQRVTLNGISTMTLQAGGHLGGQTPDMGSAAEVTIDHTGVSADLPTGGVRINFIPRDGGNSFATSVFFGFSNESLQGDNFTPALEAAGLRVPNKIENNFDLNASFGGPILQDKLWYWFSYRRNEVTNFAPINVNANAYMPNEWLPAFTNEQARDRGKAYNSSVRMTWQATPRNKFAGTYKFDSFNDSETSIGATRTIEATRDFRFPRLTQEHAEWTSPVSNNLLLEAVGMHLYERWGGMHAESARGSRPEFADVARQMIGVTDQGLGNLNYRAPSQRQNNTRVPNYTYRVAASYITGTHNIKVGFNDTFGYLEQRIYALNNKFYRFRNGVPNRVTLRAWPRFDRTDQDRDIGIYAQDRIQLDRMTIAGAIRYDNIATSYPAQHAGATEFAPDRNISFPGDEILNFKDFTYRTAWTYDLRGDGRTAIKATFNKYLRGQTLNRIGRAGNPIDTIVQTVNRSWNDANHNFVPDCDLVNPVANGECGGFSNTDFGSGRPGATFSDDLLKGFGNRETNWEFSVGAQHEVLPRVSVDVGYFRRIWKNFRVTDNLNRSASDYDFFDLVIPTHPDLPGSGGTLTGVKALKESAFGIPTANNNTLDQNYGGNTEHWNGFDITVDARLPNGLVINGGTSTGRTSWNDCNAESALPEMHQSRPLQFCERQEPWLTNAKMYAVYTIPTIDVQVAGTFRSVPGTDFLAQFDASNEYLAANSTLGRPLAGGARNLRVDLLPLDTHHRERRNELDLRIGYVLQAAGTRSVLSVDIFNATNSNAILNTNNSFSRFFSPTSILNARLVKFSVQFDF